MWVNLGLFILVWESIAVLAMIPLRLLAPEVTASELMTLGGLMAPVGLYVTRVVDRHCLGQACPEDEPPRLHQQDAETETAEETAPEAAAGLPARGARLA